MIKNTPVFTKDKRIYLMPFLLLLVFSHFVEATQNLDSEITDRTKTIQVLLQAIKQTTDKIPQSFDNPNALAKELKNVEAVHQWVHEHTVLTPYIGSLKGAKGVMIDREGNSLDRSLLLAQLLKQKGYKVRLARTQISQQQAEILFEETLTFAENLDHLVPEVSKEWQKKVKAVLPAGHQEKLEKDSKKTTDLLYDRFEISADVLLSASNNMRKYSVIEQLEREKKQQIANLMDHWWVQAEIDNEWLDFDSIFKEPYQRLSNNIHTFNVADIPESLIHKVTLEIVAEVTDPKAGKTKNHILLSRSLVASELRDSPIGLTIVPIDGPSAEETQKLLNNKEKFLSRIRDIHWWQPLLTINNKQYSDKSVSTSGIIKKKAGQLNSSSNISKSSKKITSAFGMLNTTIGGTKQIASNKPTTSDDNKKAAEPSTKTLNGMWVSITTTPSTSTSKVTRRTIYKNNNSQNISASNRALSLMSTTSIAIVTSKLNELSLIKSSNKNLDNYSVENKQNFKFLKGLFESGFNTFNLLQRQLSSVSNVLFIYEPQIYMMKNRLTLGNDKSLSNVFVFDIVKNEFNVRLIEGIDPFETRVSQGIMDTATEAGFALDIGTLKNATISFKEEKDNKGKVTLQTVSDNNDIINFYKNKGYFLLSNNRLNNSTFWRVDPYTGDILGMTDQGEGGFVEKIIVTSATVNKYASNILLFAACTKSLFKMATGRTKKKDIRGEAVKFLGGCVIAPPLKGIEYFAKIKYLSSEKGIKTLSDINVNLFALYDLIYAGW